MDEKGMNAQAFNEAVESVVNMAKVGANDTSQQTAYLGRIAQSMASIADSLEKMSDHMTADPFKKALDEYRKAREEELHV